MKKILYVTNVNKLTDPGVFKKIEAQEKSLCSLGFEVKKTYFEGDDFYLSNEYISTEKQSIFVKIKNRFVYPVQIINLAINGNFDVIYIRKSYINKTFIKFIDDLKCINKKVIIEIPTYPYEKQLRGFFKKSLYQVERIYSKKLLDRVDNIFYFGEAGDEIWGIPATRLNNGIDVNSVKLKKTRNIDGDINLLGVANLEFWHGYERLIHSIYNLDNDSRIKIRFHIVGEGSELSSLKKLTTKLGLDSNVIFYGILRGSKLDDIYDKCDIGVDSLAMYKVGLNITSSLKTKEFTARGLPFISSCKDHSFTSEVDFHYNVANDFSPINLSRIICWYEKSCFNPLEIRNYAKENLSWDKQMIKVAKCIW